MIAATLLGLVTSADPWIVEQIASPVGETVEVGGIAFPHDDVVAVSTRRGRVWLIDGVLGDQSDGDDASASWTRFADGLNEGLGLDVDGEDLLVLQRGELSRLRDVDGDRLVDDIDAITQDWGLSENYHEFAFGLPRDDSGHRYMSLNLGFMSPEWWHGVSVEPYRGWILRVTPEGDVQPWAHGFRSPCGLGFDAHGRLLATDNQGDWMPSSPIFVVEKGGFHGHPSGLRWTEAYGFGERIPDNREPPDVDRVPAAIWIPYDWSRSTGNLVTDTTGGRFGPFEDQLFVAELTTGRVLRAEIEDIDGTPQGAVWPFVDRVGSVARVTFAPDGSLICGMTNRGWGGMEPGSGVARIRWNGETPLEMQHVRLVPDGFNIEFTRPIAQAPDLSAISVADYDYNWWWKYGSPEQRSRDLDVQHVTLSDDGRTLRVSIPELQAGRVVRMRLSGVEGRGGEPLRTEEVAYTINRLPGGPVRHVARRVAAPPLESMDEDESGWLRLTWGDPTEMWTGSWRLAKDKLDPADRTRFTTEAGNNALVNDQTSEDFVLTADVPLPARVRASIMLPKQGAVGFGLPDGGTLVLRDKPEGSWIGVQSASGETLAASDDETWRGPGQWHALEFSLTEAALGKVLLDDVRVLEGVELPVGDVPRWLRVRGGVGPAGVADIRVRPQGPDAEEGRCLLPDRLVLTEGLWGGLGSEGLALSGAGTIDLGEWPAGRGVLVGSVQFTPGTAAHLAIGDVRIAIAEGRSPSPTSGSIVGHDERQVRLVPSDVEYDLKIQADGGGLDVFLNGLLVSHTRSESLEGDLRLELQDGSLFVGGLDWVADSED